MNKIKLSITAIIVLYSSISFAQHHYHNSTRDIAEAIVIIGAAKAVASAIQPTPVYVQPQRVYVYPQQYITQPPRNVVTYSSCYPQGHMFPLYDQYGNHIGYSVCN